jgi:AcrR family transcriptional regulator
VAEEPGWGTHDTGGPTTVERLVAAAGDVFAERGYDRVRVQDIARRAGLTTGAIYANFRNKAVLLLQTIGTVTDPQLDGSGTAATGRAIDELRHWTDKAVARSAGRARALLLEAFVAARRDPEVRQLLRQRVATHTRRLTEQVNAAKADGDIDPSLDTRAVVRLLQIMRFGVAPLETVETALPSDESWRAVSARIVEALAPR